MKVPFEIHFEGSDKLRDAIAYEFFVDNVKNVLNDASEADGKDIVSFVEKLAEASYIIADKFIRARINHSITKEDGSSDQER